jgi:tRNA pseudouridine13 synthase
VSSELPYAFGSPPLTGRIRATPEDFFVDELIGFAATGSGEHWLVHIEKKAANTAWAVKRVATFAGLSERDIGYAGMKDRHAVTRQYFSVPVKKGITLDWKSFSDPDVRILSAERHARKIQRGALSGNRFIIIVRDIAGDRAAADAVLAQIQQRGVPNYFGEQRFGRGGGNIDKARALFAGQRFERNERSILLSAARSEIFNAVLAQRVELQNWDRGLTGDVFQLDGRSAIFGPEPIDEVLTGRLQRGEIHPTGPLWGKGELRCTDSVAALEQDVAAAHADLCAGVAAAGMDQERRALRIRPRDLEWEWVEGDALRVAFSLPAGAYATSTLREVVVSTSI